MRDSESSIRASRTVDAFDYATVSPAIAKFLRGHATRLRNYASKSIIQIGKDLLNAKHYLPHGAFLQWVESEAGINARTAQAYMQAAEWVANKSAIVAHLPPSLLYILSAASTPSEFVEGVLSRAEAGENLTLETVRTELKAMRQHGRIRGLREPVSPPPEASTHIKHSENKSIRVVVKILAKSLPLDEFCKIRDIMMSDSVLHDPDLASAICGAFQAIEVGSSDRQTLGEERSLPPLATSGIPAAGKSPTILGAI